MVGQIKYTYTNGHPTQTSSWVSGATYLTTSATYNPNGTIATFTDANNQITKYYYNGTGGCNNLLLTSTALPVDNLTTSQTWNCDGGVLTSTTDVNGQVTNYGYLNQSGVEDPFWRRLSVRDPLGSETWTTYSTGGTLPATAETSLVFNAGASTVDTLTTFDGLGRPVLQQTKQSPTSSNYDTLSTSYDLTGRVATNGTPCVSTAPSVGCTSAVTTTTYDALARPLQVIDGGGGYTLYTYTPGSTALDVLVTSGPAPSGENTKRRQFEYDGLGRLTLVCEVLTSGGTSCGQNSAASGYKTSYAYSTPTGGGSKMVATQGAQTRTYVYDALGRLTSENNPESGTTTYYYDNIPSQCYQSGINETGVLAGVVNNDGSTVCPETDSLGRVILLLGSNGSNLCRRFLFDTSTTGLLAQPTGYSGSNLKGKVVEAETDNSCAWPIPAGSVLSDEWFSYDNAGRVTDVWEMTPHSAGYYHTTAAYWANNAVQSLTGIPGYATITYGVDGEGRPTSAQQGTTKIVCDSTCSASSTIFYPNGNPHVVNIGGTSDNDTYAYDPTGRMTSFAFTVGATPNSMSGGLTWNQNGTLRQLAITDGFNAGGTQTCNYGTSTVMGYDDLGRLLSANCGSVWSQSFSYDPYGNITKSGSLSWACATCYNSNNQYNTTLSSLISYDSAGRLLNDTFHKYTWDVYGHLSTIGGATGTITCGASGTCLTYDAFGRMVEKNVSGNYTEILYSPVGKTAIMQGQTTTSAYFPLPAGETVYETGATGGARYFWHKDWLGTVRLASTLINRTVAYDRAFGPFGERYDNFGGTQSSDFTGDTSDTISDLFDTENREYHANQGRWISPDPAGLQAVDPSNPQSWNRYVYALNNPLRYTDPIGLYCQWADGTRDDEPSDGGATYEECVGDPNNEGKWIDTVTINVTADPSEVGTTTENGEQVFPLVCPGSSNTVQTAPRYWTSWGDPNNPFWPRLNMLGTGLLNIGIGSGKVTTAAGLTAGSGGLLIGLGVYGAWSASGNFAAGGAQVLGAFAPNPEPFNNAAQIASVFTSVTGMSTVMAGGTIDSAANKAKWEGIFMSGFKAGATGNVTLPQVYSGVVTASKLVSVSSSGCK
jgi:RHS repeat-associated protein